jgi:hypothetical protein
MPFLQRKAPSAFFVLGSSELTPCMIFLVIFESIIV